MNKPLFRYITVIGILAVMALQGSAVTGVLTDQRSV